MKQLLPARARVGWLRAVQLARDVLTAATRPKRPVCREGFHTPPETSEAGEESLLGDQPAVDLPAPPESDEGEDTGDETANTVVFEHLDEQIEVDSDQTILEAGLEADLDLEFSCTMGGCAACALQIVEGEVIYDGPNCLTEKEKDSGMCLACVGRPNGRVVLERRY